MPSGVAPLLLPELAVADVPALPPQAAPLKRGTRDEVSHLIAIAIDFRGEPIRLFTTNRWVTGETWYRADDVIRMLDRFVIAEAEPSAVLNRWIGAMIQLFRPQIAALLQARDETVMAWRRRRRTHVFEDPRLEITSSLDIELDAQLALVDRARDRSDEGAFRRVPRCRRWRKAGRRATPAERRAAAYRPDYRDPGCAERLLAGEGRWRSSTPSAWHPAWRSTRR